MATIQHSALTDSDGLHEPKGVSTATSGDVYVADGAGSGSWDPLEGTEIASTGEAGANKVLREDGDGTCSWQLVNAALFDTTGVNDKYILVADGAGAAAWQEYPFGGLTYENRSTGITITGSGGTSDIKISDVLTTEAGETNSSSEFTILTTGELKYTGTLSRHFHVVCQASIDLATAATNNVVASIYKYDDSGASWARVTGSDAICTANNTTIEFVATHCDVMLDTNDKLVLALQNTGGTADVRLYTVYLFAMGMPGT